MKKITALLLLIAVCVGVLCACTAHGEKEAEPSVTAATQDTTKAEHTSNTEHPVTAEQVVSDTSQGATKAERTTKKDGKDEVLRSAKKRYGIDEHYRQTQKRHDGITEYYFEWTDKNGHPNMYDSLRLLIRDDGSITHKKRFAEKAEESDAVISQEDAVKAAQAESGMPCRADSGRYALAYYKNESLSAPRLAYKIHAGKYAIMYIDAQSGALLGKDTIK